MFDQRGRRNGDRVPGATGRNRYIGHRRPSPAAVRECAAGLASVEASTRPGHDRRLGASRQALGVRKWTVDGVSYGTFVAERYAIAHPHAVKGSCSTRCCRTQPADRRRPLPGRPASQARVLRLACARLACGFDPARTWPGSSGTARTASGCSTRSSPTSSSTRAPGHARGAARRPARQPGRSLDTIGAAGPAAARPPEHSARACTPPRSAPTCASRGAPRRRKPSAAAPAGRAPG